jgi:hypothetical protein
MIESSLGIFIAFWLLWIKLPLTIRLKALNYPFTLDLVSFIGIWMMYGGTKSGALAATFATIVMSINITFARYWWGYIGYRTNKKGVKEHGYFVGKHNVHDKLVQEKRC